MALNLNTLTSRSQWDSVKWKHMWDDNTFLDEKQAVLDYL